MVVAAQLVKQSLLTTEIPSLNPVIGKFYLSSIVIKSVLKTKLPKQKNAILDVFKSLGYWSEISAEISDQYPNDLKTSKIAFFCLGNFVFNTDLITIDDK